MTRQAFGQPEDETAIRNAVKSYTDEEGVVEAKCEGTKNQNFILRSFRVAVEDRIELEGTQIIGWDPIRQTIRSWVFDSDGGFGAGACTTQDERLRDTAQDR